MNSRALFASILLVGSACSNATSAPKSADSVKSETPTAGSSGPKRPTAANASKPVRHVLIDDLEDGDSKSIPTEARGGYWYTYHDADSVVAPDANYATRAGGPGESKHVAWMQGTVSAIAHPYVGLGLSFTDPRQPYDASSCKGIAFQGRKVGVSISAIRVKVGDWQTTPEGGLCQQCYNDFGAELTFKDTWEDFRIEFSSMKQEPYWGEPRPAIDPQALYQIQWQVSQSEQPFEIEIDNVRFIGCEGTEDISVPTAAGTEATKPSAN